MTHDGLPIGATPLEGSADTTLEASVLPVEARLGYSPRFLGQAEQVPLPGILPDLIGRLAHPYQSEEPWLRYWTYSVLMSRERRLPVVSAANFDRTNAKENDRPGAWMYDSGWGRHRLRPQPARWGTTGTSISR